MTAGRVVSAILMLLLALLIVAPIGLWSALALWFRCPGPDAVRAVAAGFAAVAAIAAIVALFTRLRWRALGAFALAFAGILVWWSTITPPQGGNWTADVARQTTGTIDGDILTLTDVRDFDWRSDDDFTEAWETRRYDLSKLKALDLILSYWAGPQMAHLIMSFEFDDGQVLAWSLEVRREKGSVYSPVADAFRSHTLVSIAATERDVVRLRSNVRGEDVQLYRLRASPAAIRTLLVGYVDEADALAREPRWYNSLTTNCTTAVTRLIRSLGGVLPFDWRLIVNGYLPSYLYDHGAVTNAIPLAELIERARIDARAKAADGSPDFSRLIRVGVPAPDGKPLM
ncbi:uncharacterized protein DUF4105 [Roseiarcus fermentans]|uniref:Uncharacterized protein DUF4105 n=1 Tax=Roseiarcus fermentans TaxID=1473586 RepID=A0A366EMX5_9HYPH|nr:DUF4105 domain-containing protein [Roseiarcus fermentans]RBP02805.1 uncharacterized protein DUF4105 [Roseiarcus fermentans]